MILDRLNSLAKGLHFLVKNLKHFAGFPNFPNAYLVEGVTVRACTPSDVHSVLALRNKLGQGAFSWPSRILLKLMPSKSCVVVCNLHGTLDGVSFFYFNERDFLEDTIHEGFIGIRPECAGLGIATCLRRFAAAHFSGVDTLSGISSRITMANSASVASGIKAGYELLERYTDPASGEERGYFINRFRREARK